MSSKHKDTQEGSLQTSNTPVLKAKLQESLHGGQNNSRFGSQMDSLTKKMIVGYKQLKKRRDTPSEEDKLGVQEVSLSSDPQNKDADSGSNVQPDKKSSNDPQQPTKAHFQMAIVGYREKRQKTDLEQELEASLRDNTPPVTNTTGNGFFPRGSHLKGAGKFGRIKGKLGDIEIGGERDPGVASDFEANLAGDIGLRSRKLYSQ